MENKKIITGCNSISLGNRVVTNDPLLNIDISCGTATLNAWNDPVRIDVLEFSDRIEFIYKEISKICFSSSAEERIFKIIFSCVDGKWSKSDRIYGKIIPPQEETYEF